MTRPLIVLRPEPGLGETLALARAMGLPAIGAPLFAIEPVEWSAPDPAGFDAILAGSANAFRYGGGQLARLAGLPVHAVGDSTAQAARTAGFTVTSTGTGGLQPVLDSLPSGLRLLRLAGEWRVPLRAPAGIAIDERVVYRAAPLPLAAEAAGALGEGAVAVIHSGEAARWFADECVRLGIDRARVSLAVLAPRIAEAAGEGWRLVAIAPRTSDAALLAMAADMCQTVR